MWPALTGSRQRAASVSGRAGRGCRAAGPLGGLRHRGASSPAQRSAASRRAAASSRLSPAHRTLPAPAWPTSWWCWRCLETSRHRTRWCAPGGEVIGQVLASLVADGLVVDQSLAWPRARPGCWTAPRDSSPLAGICPRCSWPMRISRHRCRGVRRPMDGATVASSAAVPAQPGVKDPLGGGAADGFADDQAPERR